jgi:hypothetical protein
LRGVVQHLAFLGRKLTKSSSLDFPLTCLRWHSAQRLDGVSHGLLAVRGKALELRIQRPELLFLLRRQVLPGFHAPEDLLLPIWWHAIEVLQALFEFLLAIARQTPELRVILQRAFLLIKRLLAMLVQPLPRVMALCGRLIRARNLTFPQRRLRCLGLGLKLRPVLWL